MKMARPKRHTHEKQHGTKPFTLFSFFFRIFTRRTCALTRCTLREVSLEHTVCWNQSSDGIRHLVNERRIDTHSMSGLASCAMHCICLLDSVMRRYCDSR